MNENRMKLKSNLATALSDMGLVGNGKLPDGRLDTLVDRLDEAPYEFQVLASSAVGPTKHTAEWRVANLWATTMTVATRKVSAPRTPAADRAPPRIKKLSKRVWLDMGMVQMRKGLEKELFGAGQDYHADNPDFDMSDCGVARDLAEGTLIGEGLERSSHGYSKVLSYAADIVHSGLTS